MSVWVFSLGLSLEASLAPSLIWPGRCGLGAGPHSPTLHGHRNLPPPQWSPGTWGCRGQGRAEGVGWHTGHAPLVPVHPSPCLGLWAACGGAGDGVEGGWGMCYILGQGVRRDGIHLILT